MDPAPAHPACTLLLCGLLAILAGGCGGRGPKPATLGAEAAGPLRFRDSTAASGIALVTTSGRAPSTQILEVKGGGLALFDMEQDGDFDLLVPNGATLDAPASGPGARLFENLGGLRFRDVTAASGIAWRGWSFGTAVADFDGDGRDDVFIAGYGGNALLRNLGGGRFEDIAIAAGVRGGGWATAAAAGDLDGDGDLDLYVARFLRFDPAAPPPPMEFMGVPVFAGPRGLEPEPDQVFENLGEGRFRDATEAWGFAQARTSYGLGVLILDVDGDGAPEVFVGNDSQPNFLFVRGPDGRYTDRGVASGIAVNENGSGQATMGIAVADVDGNGLPDVFTSNFMNDTNTLHANQGGLLFLDWTQRYGLGLVSRPFVGWAAGFFDFDHDGDEDLVVFNGHTYPPEITDARGWMHAQVPLLFRREKARFERVEPAEGGAWLATRRCDRSAAFGDLDLDGDVDIVVTGLNEPVLVLENVGTHVGRWLQVELRDPRPGARNPRGLGARLELSGPAASQVRWIHTAGSYHASSPPVAHFGLGAELGPWRLHVRWPDGHVQETALSGVERRLLLVRE
jgi:hypothetical protein